MGIPERTLLDSPDGRLKWMITDDGSYTLLNAETGETYHSGCGAVAESAVVYLRNSGVMERLSGGRPTKVLEVGFGTGTAFLLTAAWAERTQTQLQYFAIENRLLPSPFFQQLDLSQRASGAFQAPELGFPISPEWLGGLSELQAGLLAFLQSIEANVSQQPSMWERRQLTPHVELVLWLADVRDYPHALFASFFDAVYFDPFSPATNPELWNPAVLSEMHAMLTPHGSLTSYCVKGEVRRALAEVGFLVAKAAGPAGGKREVLVCTRPA